MKISLTERQKEQLRALGFKDEEMTPELLVNIKLYQEALSGKVQAINSVKALLQDEAESGMEASDDLTQEVEREEKKILKNLSGLTKTQLAINRELIHNVAFQSVALRHLTEDIAKNGVKEKYKNGANQWGYKDRTEVKTYNNMIKSYQSCMKQLNDLLIGCGDEDDGFDDF